MIGYDAATKTFGKVFIFDKVLHQKIDRSLTKLSVFYSSVMLLLIQKHTYMVHIPVYFVFSPVKVLYFINMFWLCT